MRVIWPQGSTHRVVSVLRSGRRGDVGLRPVYTRRRSGARHGARRKDEPVADHDENPPRHPEGWSPYEGSYPASPAEMGDGYPSYGAASRDKFGSPRLGASDEDFRHGPDGTVQRRHAGPIRLGEAIVWGFKAAFRNWNPLMVLAGLATLGFLVYTLLHALHGFDPAASPEEAMAQSQPSPFAQIVIGVASVALAPFWYNAAVSALDTNKIGWGGITGGIRYVPIVVVLIIHALLTAGIMWLFFTPLEQAALDIVADPASLDYSLGGAIWLFLGGILVSCLVSPLFLFWGWAAADGASVGQAIVGSVRVGIANYGKLLLFILAAVGFSVVFGMVVGVLSVITLGLGGVAVSAIVIPAITLVTGHIYRQAAGGWVPVN